MNLKTFNNFHDDILGRFLTTNITDFHQLHQLLKDAVFFICENVKYDECLGIVKYDNNTYFIQLNKHLIVSILDDLAVLNARLLYESEMSVILEKILNYSEYIYDQITSNNLFLSDTIENQRNNVRYNTIQYLDAIGTSSIEGYSTKYVYSNYITFFENRGLVRLKKDEFQSIIKRRFGLTIKYLDVYKLKNEIKNVNDISRPRANAWVWGCDVDE